MRLYAAMEHRTQESRGKPAPTGEYALGTKRSRQEQGAEGPIHVAGLQPFRSMQFFPGRWPRLGNWLGRWPLLKQPFTDYSQLSHRYRAGSDYRGGNSNSALAPVFESTR